MAKIRVGIIGLSASAETSWASSAHLPYLQVANGKYAITTLCNSSVAAAEAAIKAFNLPSSIKAYGNPQDLASDEDIDLVVCNTRVDVHYETIKPSLLAGKSIYCEWPLAQNLEKAKELYDIAKANNARTVIGLQGQLSPMVLKIEELIDQGRIGKVLSSTVLAFGGSRTRDTLIEGISYFAQRKVGGNMVTIGFAHTIDFVTAALGELSSFRTQLSTQRPLVPIIGADGKVKESVTTDVPDHIILSGTLASGAPLSITFRRGQPFKDSPGLNWYIHGEKGEIRLTAKGSQLQAIDDEVNIVVDDFEKDDLEVVPWERRFRELPGPARNVAAMYEGFAGGDQRVPDFGHAVMRHRMIDEVFRSGEEDTRVRYL